MQILAPQRDCCIDNLRNCRLVVYGSGGAFHWFFEIFFLRKGIKPELVVDKRFQNQQNFLGFPASDDITACIPEWSRSQYVILICLGNQELIRAVAKTLFEQGFFTIYSLHDFYEVHTPFKDQFSSKVTLEERGVLAEKIWSRLGDLHSKTLFEKLYRIHSYRQPEWLPRSDPNGQWFPSDLPAKLNYENYICAGVDDDNFRLSRVSMLSPRSCIFIEADKFVYDEFSKGLILHPVLRNTSVFFLAALSNSTSLASFSSANDAHLLHLRGHTTGFGSRLSDQGSTKVATVRLDDIPSVRHPTLISMDIEGNEFNSLLGAERTIKKSRPDLAISVYHQPDDILMVPDYILSLDLPYKIFLRNYTGYVAETILYAFCE
jgi:FkbM family methyltransferase